MLPDRTIVFFDGDSRFWVREVRFLKRLDRRHRFHFTDISARGFDARIFNKNQQTLTAEIHALRPDGTWIRGAEVLRHVYASVGFGPLVFVTRLPLIRQVSNLSIRILNRYLPQRRGAVRRRGTRASGQLQNGNSESPA